MSLRAGLLALVLLLPAAPVPAAGEYDRALRVDLTTLRGDARLLENPATPQIRQSGLWARMASTLGALGMTARQTVDRDGDPAQPLVPAVADLQADFHNGQMSRFRQRIESLTARFPLDISYFFPLTITPERAKTGEKIYRQLCIGCHQNPDLQAANPAPNLFLMARSAPPGEFVARMLGGIHGVPRTTLKNPFSDEEIAALIVYFTTEKP